MSNSSKLVEWRSLRTRITLFTLCIFIVSIWSLTLYASRVLRQDMQDLVSAQQVSTVSVLAGEINRGLEDRLRSLESVAGTINPAMLDNPLRLQQYLEQLPLLRSLFNGGIVAIRADGQAIADVPLAAGRIGVNYLDIDSVAAALREGKAAIGQPIIDKKLQAPVFGIATPIRDSVGRIVGALSGVTNLGEPNFLGRATESRYGRTGGFELVSRQTRRVITATDPRHETILPEPGTHPVIDRFVQGFDGSAVLLNPFGVEVLASVKSIPIASWFVVVTLPTTEAFAPIYVMQQRMLLAAIVLSLLAGSLTWLMLRRQLAPLLSTASTLASLPENIRLLRPLPITRRDEIGELIGGFNRLLGALSERDAHLRESEERYRSFFQYSPDAILVYRNYVTVFVNDAAVCLFHADTAAALIGRGWQELVAPEDRALTEAWINALVRGEVSYLPPLERRHRALDGTSIVMEAAASNIIFDGKPAVIAVLRDVTQRRLMEARHLAEARQQRDTLVREVHHRIKNNLQSVAGLLQRELGKFVELDPRLETAIGQVHSIAVVHGLQSTNPDEAIRLCDSVSSICRTASELSQRPVLYHLENEHTSFRPTRIENSEAVPVALMLNELILNAVKHSPEGAVAPTVTLNAEGGRAQVTIRNALKGVLDPDLLAGNNFGTGLRLVHSLLPKKGAELTFEIDAEGFMLIRLKLVAPVVEAAEQKEAGGT